MAHKKIIVNLGHEKISLWDNNINTPMDLQIFPLLEELSINDSLYCYSSQEGEVVIPNDGFFISNLLNYFPKYDRELIINDERRALFFQTIAQEYDKIQDIIKDLSTIADVDSVREDFLPYLAYLLGYQVSDFTLSNFNLKELVKNLIAIYKIKGTNYAYEVFFNSMGFDVELNELWWENATNEIANSISKRLYLKHFDELSPESISALKYRVQHNEQMPYYNLPENFYTLNKSNYISIRLSRKDPNITGFTSDELSLSKEYLNFLTPAHINVLNINLVFDYIEEFLGNLWDTRYMTVRISGNIQDMEIKDVPVAKPILYNHDYLQEQLFYSRFGRVMPIIPRHYNSYEDINIIKFDKSQTYKYKEGIGARQDFKINNLGLFFGEKTNKARIDELYNQNLWPSLLDVMYWYVVQHFSHEEMDNLDLATIIHLLTCREIIPTRVHIWEDPVPYLFSRLSPNYKPSYDPRDFIYVGLTEEEFYGSGSVYQDSDYPINFDIRLDLGWTEDGLPEQLLTWISEQPIRPDVVIRVYKTPEDTNGEQDYLLFDKNANFWNGVNLNLNYGGYLGSNKALTYLNSEYPFVDPLDPLTGVVEQFGNIIDYLKIAQLMYLPIEERPIETITPEEVFTVGLCAYEDIQMGESVFGRIIDWEKFNPLLRTKGEDPITPRMNYPHALRNETYYEDDLQVNFTRYRIDSNESGNQLTALGESIETFRLKAFFILRQMFTSDFIGGGGGEELSINASQPLEVTIKFIGEPASGVEDEYLINIVDNILPRPAISESIDWEDGSLKVYNVIRPTNDKMLMLDTDLESEG